MIEDVGLLRVQIEIHQQFIEVKQGEAVCQSKMGILNFDAHCIVCFPKPTRPEYQRGVEAVFVASVARSEILADPSPWILESVRWRGKSDFGD